MARNFTTDIINIIRQDIESGKYDNISFLPSERQLSQTLNAGRGVIKTALQRLRDEGVINIIPNRGAILAKKNKKKSLTRFLVRCNSSHNHSYNEWMGVLAGICNRAAELNVEVVMAFSESDSFKEEIAERYMNRDIQGIIFIEDCYEPKLIPALKTIGIPYLVANQESDNGCVNCRVDFREVGRIAGRHLVEAGHRQIGIVAGMQTHHIYREMLAGFRGALAEDEVAVSAQHIIEFSYNLFTTQNTKSLYQSKVYQKFLQLLNSPDCPTAFFAMRDNRASLIYHAAQELGLTIPTDVSVISYDNISWPEGAYHGLTTIIQPTEKIGRIAVSMLAQWCKSGQVPEIQKISGTLLKRSSIKEI